MPRVVRVITRLNRGGPLRQLEALVPGLIQRGWHGPVVAGLPERHESDGADALLSRGVEVLRLPALRRTIEPTTDGRAFDQLVRMLRRAEPDVVHTHMGKAGALGRLAARVLGIPAVHTLHGHHFDRGGLRGRAARAAERALGRATAALVCLSAGQRRDILRHAVVPAARVHLIEPGLIVQDFESRPRLPSAFFELVFTGRFVDVKDPLLLVRTVATLPADVRLTMWGDGPLWCRVAEVVRQHGLTDRVRLPGESTDVASAVAGADLFVLSSRSEGVALSAIEAMLLGVPVVVPRVGGLPDIVRDGDTGRLVPPGDLQALRSAILELRADPSARARIAQTARRMAQVRFDGERLAEQTASLYDTVIRLRVSASRRGGRRSGR